VSAQKDAFEDISDAAPKTSFDRLTGLLRKEKILPRKRKGLEGKVKSWFSDLSVEERVDLVEQLFRDGVVKESEKKELMFVMARMRRG
jgi:hypothetical protein